MDIQFLTGWVMMGVLIIVFAYLLVRSISFAYFRTKLEHFRSVMKEFKEGED